jgi:MFS family permease
MSNRSAQPNVAASAGLFLLPLALGQFIASYASSSLNVSISAIAKDLDTDVHGVQVAITAFTLTMAALMIPGSRLSDRWGRKNCFILGLAIYGLGAAIAAISTKLAVLVVGYSILQGIGSALLIPPIYILVTVSYGSTTSKARAFGIVSAMAGVGAAAGPLIGGLITTSVSWRASFVLQAVVVVAIALLSSRIADKAERSRGEFDYIGTVLSGLGLALLVIGILQASNYGVLSLPVLLLVLLGILFLGWFYLHISSRTRHHRQALVSPELFRSRVGNLGLITQTTQWLVLMGASFVVSVYLQEVRGYSAVATGLLFTPATAGLLITSLLAGRFARRRPQRTLIRAGFLITSGALLLIVVLGAIPAPVAAGIGLFVLGAGIGIMLTASVNVVQSGFSEELQGEISGVSRSASNLGSSLGTALVGSVLVAFQSSNGYAVALVVMALFAALGFVVAMLLPAAPSPQPTTPEPRAVSPSTARAT